ncbi:MAG: type II toxin-antitoxin system VapC family toxin [Sporichthyaceae bacterium]
MLLLDSEGLSALAHGPPARRAAVRALLAEARSGQEPVATVAAVLAEVVRGRGADAAVFSALRSHRILIQPVDTDIAVRAGRLLEACRAGSELAVDAFLIAHADLAGGAVIATSDTEDLGRLATHCASPIRVLPI